MRDIAVVLFLILAAYYAIRIPWTAALSLALLAYLNPHRYAWGFSRSLPVYQLVFIATVFGMVLNPKSRRPFPWTRETGLFFMLLIWFTFTTYIASPDFPWAAEAQWQKVMKVYAGIFPTFFLIRTQEHLKWLIIIIAISFGFIGMKGGLFSLMTGFSYLVWGPAGTFYGGNNEIGLALNMILPLCLLCISFFKKKTVRVFFIAMFVLTIFSIIGTHSRGALITLIVTLFTIMALGKIKWLFISIPLVILAVFLGQSYLPSEWTDRMKTIETYDEDASVQGRFDAWNYAIDRAKTNPITGGGFETFRCLAHDAHNAYFEILGEHGYFALFLYCNLLFGTMIAYQRIFWYTKKTEQFAWMPPYARALQISLVAYAVGSLSLGTAYWEILYQLIGLCTVMKMLIRENINQGAFKEI